MKTDLDVGNIAAERIRQLLADLSKVIPTQGPPAIFRHENELAAFEDQPFSEAADTAMRRYGVSAYLSEEKYREKVACGQISVGDIDRVLEADLNGLNDNIAGLTTVLELRRFLLTKIELIDDHWRSEDYLHEFPQSIDNKARAALLGASEYALRVANNSEEDSRIELSRSERIWLQQSVEMIRLQIYDRVGTSTKIEMSGKAGSCGEVAEEVALRLQWLVCSRGVQQVGRSQPPFPQHLRLRNLLLKVTGDDADQAVHRILVPFCEAFLSPGMAQWQMPNREEGFFIAFAKLYQSGSSFGQRLLGLAPELATAIQQKQTPIHSIIESLQRLGIADRDIPEFIEATVRALPGWSGMINRLERHLFQSESSAFDDAFAGFVAIRLILDRLSAEQIGRSRLGVDVPYHKLHRAVLRQFPLSDLTLENVEHRTFPVFRLAVLKGWDPLQLLRKPLWVWASLVSEVEDFTEIYRKPTYQQAWEYGYWRSIFSGDTRHRVSVRTACDSPRFQAVFCCSNTEEAFREKIEYNCSNAETFGTPGHWGLSFQYHLLASPNQPIPMGPFGRGSTHHIYETNQSSVGIGQSEKLSRFNTVRKSMKRIALAIAASSRRELPEVPELEIESSEPLLRPNGFNVSEMADYCEQFLMSIGLMKKFADIVLLLGHSYTGVPQPFHCGLCGTASRANSRVSAKMLNDNRVRRILHQRGIEIPRETVFIAGEHQNQEHKVIFFDCNSLSDSQNKKFASISESVKASCLCDSNVSKGKLSEASIPGHTGNAVCFVGPRETTRSMAYANRAFLISYDQATDSKDARVLARLLGSAVSDCIHVNLQYYFSRVDPERFGTGNTPAWHSSSPLGVIEGKCQDLRTGLPWFVVKNHEPLRLLVVVESSQEALSTALAHCEFVETLVSNGWIRLAVWDAKLSQLHLYGGGVIN